MHWHESAMDLHVMPLPPAPHPICRWILYNWGPREAPWPTPSLLPSQHSLYSLVRPCLTAFSPGPPLTPLYPHGLPTLDCVWCVGGWVHVPSQSGSSLREEMLPCHSGYSQAQAKYSLHVCDQMNEKTWVLELDQPVCHRFATIS